MAVPTRYILHQLPVIAGLLRAMGSALLGGARGPKGPPPPLPGPELRATLPPRPRDLVRAYVRQMGGDPAAYRGVLPPHLFPQWGFGLASRTVVGVGYPLEKIVNAGCRLEVGRRLPDDERLEVGARLESIDDDGYRALFHYRIATSTVSAPDALVGHIFAIVPLAKKSGAKKEPVTIPAGAREIAYHRLGPQAGLDFAKLTGDFNPVHWLRPYARAFGYRSTILHGFATMALAFEGLVRGHLAGAADAIAELDVKFGRPLLLPAKVGVYLGAADRVYVGDAPGARPYLEGTFRLRASE